MAAALQRSGALQDAGEWASRYALSAHDHLLVLPTSPSRELLASFADLAVNRHA